MQSTALWVRNYVLNHFICLKLSTPFSFKRHQVALRIKVNRCVCVLFFFQSLPLLTTNNLFNIYKMLMFFLRCNRIFGVFVSRKSGIVYVNEAGFIFCLCVQVDVALYFSTSSCPRSNCENTFLALCLTAAFLPAE